MLPLPETELIFNVSQPSTSSRFESIALNTNVRTDGDTLAGSRNFHAERGKKFERLKLHPKNVSTFCFSLSINPFPLLLFFYKKRKSGKVAGVAGGIANGEVEMKDSSLNVTHTSSSATNPNSLFPV